MWVREDMYKLWLSHKALSCKVEIIYRKIVHSEEYIQVHTKMTNI